MTTAFSTLGARLAGISARALRDPDLSIPTRGMRIPVGIVPDPYQPAGGWLELNDYSFCSHSTAARIWGIPLPPRLQDDDSIHIARPREVQPIRRGPIAGHRLDLLSQDIVMFRGLKLTSPERTWLDMARQLSRDELVAAGDYLVCSYRRSARVMREPVVDLGQLRGVLDRYKGVPGIPKARTAIDDVRVGVDSPQETRTRLLIVRCGFPEPQVNIPLTDPETGRRRWVDMGYPQLKLGIEYEGDQHREREQWDSDIERDEIATRLGWRILRVTARHLTGTHPEIIDRLERILRVPPL